MAAVEIAFPTLPASGAITLSAARRADLSALATARTRDALAAYDTAAAAHTPAALLAYCATPGSERDGLELAVRHRRPGLDRPPLETRHCRSKCLSIFPLIEENIVLPARGAKRIDILDALWRRDVSRPVKKRREVTYKRKLSRVSASRSSAQDRDAR